MRFDRLMQADGTAGGSTGGAAAAAPPAAPPAPAAAPPPPPVDTKAIAAEQRAAVLKDLGFADEASFEAHKKAEDKKRKDAMSETERDKAALTESLDARGKAEAKAEEAKAKVKELEESIKLRDSFDAQGVTPKDRVIVDALYRDAKKATGFDDAKFFEELRKERPYLFGGAAPPAPVTPGAPAPVGASQFGGTLPGAPGADFDAMRATPAQRRAQRYGNA